ncbi:MAG TPA: hypothetical protein VNQ77_13570 [Frankiaceae bacterium]|nr:hypothetical protein [Frankiaceae bacterium]
MLVTAFRDGFAAVRAAGWRALALSLLSYTPVALAEAVPNVLLVVATFVLQVIVVLALIRLLGAHRPVPVPAPPQVDESGRRVLGPKQPGPPLTDADRSPVVALRNAFALARTALRLTGLILLAQFAAILTVIALSGGKVADYSENVLLLTALPVSALFLTFIAVAPQRVALEGETRVLVATAHSVRIARQAYGPLLLITVVEPAVTAAGSFGGVAGVAGAIAAAALLQTWTTAAANEIYLAGPRLELPVPEPTT